MHINGARAAPEEPKTLNPSTPHYATAKRLNFPLFPSGASHLGLSRTSLTIQMTVASRPTPSDNLPVRILDTRLESHSSLGLTILGSYC